MQGNLGHSLQRFNETVSGLIAHSRIGPTLLLMAASLAIAIVIGVTTGIISAGAPQFISDYSFSVLALLGISSPAFLTALLGLYVFPCASNGRHRAGC